LFFKRQKKPSQTSYDPSKQIPILHCSICTGEKVAGFRDIETGKFEDVMLIRSAADLEAFKRQYGITGEIAKEY